jgi:uncharacterized protein (TIGR03067 family)
MRLAARLIRPLIVAASLLLVLCGTSPLRAQSKKDGKQDLPKLQGNWKLITLVQNGKSAEVSKSIQGTVLTIRGERITQNTSTKVMQLKLQGGSPRQIDFKVVEGESKGETQLGIYILEGNLLMICQQKETRPTAFESVDDSGCRLLVFERAP